MAIAMMGVVAAFCLMATVIGLIYVKKKCAPPVNYTRHPYEDSRFS